tara:strand:+ start:794 stop:1027 length:234 start_codon:yes stop_codon:yes gene_type:complete
MNWSAALMLIRSVGVSWLRAQITMPWFSWPCHGDIASADAGVNRLLKLLLPPICLFQPLPHQGTKSKKSCVRAGIGD